MQNIGVLQSGIYCLKKTLEFSGAISRPYKLYSKHSKHPLLCRPRTSDREVYLQIFAEREYQCLDEVKSAELIIDCGANIGYSSAYFLTRFPGSKVIAVEPDPENFALLKKNLAWYDDRSEALLKGVWSNESQLVMSEEPFSDGREWSRTVRSIRSGEIGMIDSIDIGTILKRSGFARISILKIDIEGSEIEVFSSGVEEWLGKVDNLVIELHGHEARAVCIQAIADQGFETREYGELFVCRRFGQIK